MWPVFVKEGITKSVKDHTAFFNMLLDFFISISHSYSPWPWDVFYVALLDLICSNFQIIIAQVQRRLINCRKGKTKIATNFKSFNHKYIYCVKGAKLCHYGIFVLKPYIGHKAFVSFYANFKPYGISVSGICNTPASYAPVNRNTCKHGFC